MRDDGGRFRDEWADHSAVAEEIAERWLADRGELTTDEAEVLPGYCTLHTLRDGGSVADPRPARPTS